MHTNEKRNTVHMCMYVHIYILIHTHMCMCIYIYMCIYTAPVSIGDSFLGNLRILTLPHMDTLTGPGCRTHPELSLAGNSLRAWSAGDSGSGH